MVARVSNGRVGTCEAEHGLGRADVTDLFFTQMKERTWDATRGTGIRHRYSIKGPVTRLYRFDLMHGSLKSLPYPAPVQILSTQLNSAVTPNTVELLGPGPYKLTYGGVDLMVF
jgi:hypothetical protein